MSLRFTYLPIRVPHPVFSLGGRGDRPRPLISVTLMGPKRSLPPEWMAHSLGVDLTNAHHGFGRGIGQTPLRIRYAPLTLRIADNQERREWSAIVAFTAARIQTPLLGFAGFLQFFVAKFDGDLEVVELTVNRKYPGI